MRTLAISRASCALFAAVALAASSVPGRAQQHTPTPAPNAAPGGKDAAQPPQAAPKSPKASTAEDNPFPEEQSQAAQKQASADDRADRAAANAGGVKSGVAADQGSSSRDKLAGMDILGERDSRISNGAGGTIVDPKLSLQDVKVGQQYFGMGNYQGAYERFKEACLVNPDNVEAVFYLAEAARRTAHLDESAENYKLYLAAQPSGSKAKQARKALAQLEGK